MFTSPPNHACARWNSLRGAIRLAFAVGVCVAIALFAITSIGCGTSRISTPTGVETDGAAPMEWLKTPDAEFVGFTEPPNVVNVDELNQVKKATALPSTTMVYVQFILDSPKDVVLSGVVIEMNEGFPTHIEIASLAAIVSEPIRADVESIQALQKWVEELNETQRQTVESIAPGLLDVIKTALAASGL